MAQSEVRQDLVYVAPEAADAFVRQLLAAHKVPDADAVTLYPPVPTSVARVANVERMQMLIESPSRAALQRFLSAWLPALHELRRTARSANSRILRWAIDVDPLSI